MVNNSKGKARVKKYKWKPVGVRIPNKLYKDTCASFFDNAPVDSPPVNAAVANKLLEYSFDTKITHVGVKYDSDKLRTDLLPIRPMEDIAKVLTFGAKKYSPRNWEYGITWGRCYGAAIRHLFAWWRGENCDPETGLSHLAHAACCIMFLQEYEYTRAGKDDRSLPPPPNHDHTPS